MRANERGRTDGRAFAQHTRDILRAEIVTPTDMRPRTRSKANIRNDTPPVDSRRLAATREERKSERENRRRKRVEKEKEEKERRVRGGEGEETVWRKGESGKARARRPRKSVRAAPEKVHEPPRQK